MEQVRTTAADVARNFLTAVVILASTAALALAGLAMYHEIENNAAAAREAEATHAALCALRENVRIRRDRAVEFLIKNPEGIPGIPRPLIQQSIDDRNQTLFSLRLLRCGETNGS